MRSSYVCFFVFVVLFLPIFHNTITNMAGFYIVSDLGGSTKTAVYCMVFFGLGSLLSLPLALSCIHRFGEKNVLVSCLMLFAAFSLLCSFSPTFFAFNVFRFCAGFSAGPFYILCRRLMQIWAPQERASLYSFVMILIFSIVPVLGASFGAWIAYDYQWQWIFPITLPIPLALAGYFGKVLPPEGRREPLPFDTVGYLFFFFGIGSLVTALTMAEELDWFRSSLWTWGILGGALSFLCYMRREWSHPTPLLGLSLLKSFRLSFSLLSLTVLFSSYFGMIFLLALWLNIYVNYTPMWIAVLMSTMGFAGIVAIPVGHLLLRQVDPRKILGVAILCFMISCYYSTFFDVEVDFFHLAVARSLAGLGLILFLYPLFSMALSSYDASKSLQVFTLFQAVRLLSSSLGAALYVIVWHRRQIFFHERLGEGITPFSQETIEYFSRASSEFFLSYEQAKGELEDLLTKQATSLALNDVLGLMGYILLGLFIFLILSFFKKSMHLRKNPL